MSIYTRLTVAGATRRAEVVVASTEPLGAALPRLLDLLGETEGTVARPLTLVTPDGEQVDIARSPQQLDLGDGTLVRLVRLDAAPPPPVVIDVTDAAADAHDARPDRWDDRARAIAGGSAIALAFATAGLLAPWSGTNSAPGALLVITVALTAVATGLGLGGLRRIAACVAAGAAGLIVPLLLAATGALQVARFPGDDSLIAGIGAALATASTLVLLAIGVGRRSPGAAAGGALGAVLATLLLVLPLFGVGAVATAAVVGVVAAFATGPLPWVALSAAGLTDLDQRVADGERVARTRAFASIDDAYSALSWSVAATAIVLAVAGTTLVFADELWAGLLALAFALVAALRTRAFPLRTQGWMLWGAVAAIALSALLLHGTAIGFGWGGAAIAVVAAAIVAATIIVKPRAHVRARLRGLGNTIEALAVVALLPLLLGSLGIYAELLGMFGGGA